jgi:hypothetical protein
MNLQGKWRIVEMPDYDDDFPDLMGPAYILFGPTGGEFAFGCVTGSFPGSTDANAVAFDWDGNDEMDEACGDGGPNFSPTARSQAKTASTAGMKSPSPPALRRLLQQPARRGERYGRSSAPRRRLRCPTVINCPFQRLPIGPRRFGRPSSER